MQELEPLCNSYSVCKAIEHAEGARMDWMLWELVIDGKLQPSLDGDDIAFSAPK